MNGYATSRLGLWIVGIAGAIGLTLIVACYLRSTNVPYPATYSIPQDSTEAEIADMEADFLEAELELDASLDEIDAELEAQYEQSAQ